jgi:uncharacterized membrane protein (DUF441 family)
MKLSSTSAVGWADSSIGSTPGVVGAVGLALMTAAAEIIERAVTGAGAAVVAATMRGIARAHTTLPALAFLSMGRWRWED